MPYINIDLTGTAFAHGLESAWGDDHDMRAEGTKYEEDVVQFVSDMLDVIGDPEADRRLHIMLTNRLRAADEAEGRQAGDGESMYAAGERSGYADWTFAFMDLVPDDVDAESPSAVAQWARDAVAETRAAVARDLEQMDGTNLGRSLTRGQAVNVARHGLRPCDVQRGSSDRRA
ncbi:hypothetical protein OG436_29675 [Streptomyces caniferus]|uniref:hypothetical protein n=1 Tax=Streptomyces caniferus TaxID=285557 RepID=UPI002E2865F7|nr:hypothetical protein [Streptomyces caniferus]